jgi:hypothetical protein
MPMDESAQPGRLGLAQRVSHYTSGGVRYPRIAYGDDDARWGEVPCRGCGASNGQFLWSAIASTSTVLCAGQASSGPARISSWSAAKWKVSAWSVVPRGLTGLFWHSSWASSSFALWLQPSRHGASSRCHSDRPSRSAHERSSHDVLVAEQQRSYPSAHNV